MGRTEHYNDPNAPKANSLVPAASTVVFDDDGWILLHHRSDNGMWSLPGGAMEVGETISQCAIREVKEETGLDVEVIRLVGVYSDPNHVIEYSNGEVRQEFSICFQAKVVSGHLQLSTESRALEWISPADLDNLNLQPSIRMRIHDAISGTGPHIR